GADDQPTDESRIAKAHLGFRGMDIDVYIFRRDLEKQRHGRMAVAGEKILIGAAHRTLKELVAHGPAVDEQKLKRGRAAMISRQSSEPEEPDAIALRIDGKRVLAELAAEHRREAPETRDTRIVRERLRRDAQRAAPIARQRKANLRARHRQPL